MAPLQNENAAPFHKIPHSKLHRSHQRLKSHKIVMNHNIFSFADTYWHQLSGMAMGTPTACPYATITYGHFENSEILPRFNNNLLYYKRYIDDIFGIWIPSTDNNSDS